MFSFFYLLVFFHSDFWSFSTEMATLQLASLCFLCSRVKCKVTSFFQNTNFKFLGERLWVTQLQIGVHAWFNQWQLESLGYMITDPIQQEEAVIKERLSLSTVHSPPKMSTPGGLWLCTCDWKMDFLGGSRGREHMYTYGWFMLIFGRNQWNSVKQLSFNWKIN